MAEAYDVQAIERKWQRRWADAGTYQVENDDPRPRCYVLCMYPYPSGPAHMGHVRNYTFGDLIVRYRTMHGHAVLSPIGFDSFGLPAENAAIKSGSHPRAFTDARIEELKQSLMQLGASYDWRREIKSHDPEYIRWTQWIFLRFLEAGLAYRKAAPVNWCPGCQTVLANEQVLADGTCERSGDVVTKRNLEQWFFRITEYADQLLDDLDDLQWPERVKVMQRNWIGRSEGAEFDLPIVGDDDAALVLRVFTTRPDTSFGMTYAVVAPDHPLVPALTTDEQREAVESFVARVATATDVERQAGKEGVFTGLVRDEPLHREAGARVRGRLRADGLRHRGHHGGARPGPARLGLRPAPRPRHHPHRPASRRLGRRGLHRRGTRDQQRVARRAARGRCDREGDRLARATGASGGAS